MALLDIDQDIFTNLGQPASVTLVAKVKMFLSKALIASLAFAVLSIALPLQVESSTAALPPWTGHRRFINSIVSRDSQAPAAGPYALRCNDYHLHRTYMSSCRDKFAAQPRVMFEIIKGGGDLCIESSSGVHVSGRAIDDTWAEASGKQIAEALERVMDVCTYRGGSASAAFNMITGMDFVVHVADHSV